MNDRAVSLFEKYNITIEKTRKGRGSIIAESDSGSVALVEYNGSKEHLAMESFLLQQLSESFPGEVDCILPTEEGELFCTDFEGKKYIVKKYVEGRECNVLDIGECVKAAAALAQLHLALRGITLPDPLFSHQGCVTESENSGQNNESEIYREDNPRADFDRRNAELVRTRNYIRKSPSKDDFALAFLGVYERYMEQSTLAYTFLNEGCARELQEKQIRERMYVHGDCNHHNVLIAEKGVTFINFEKTGAHLQVKDIYLFMRKILEKNDWCYDLGRSLLEAYQNVLPLDKAELDYLYARFLYPEKFWKIANGYLNRRKSLPARRQHEKLADFEQKEEKRQLFLNKWLETCR